MTPEPEQPRVLGATRALLGSFATRSGRWRMPTGEAWQPALAIEAVLLAYECHGDEDHLAVVRRSFARYRGRRSRFYDDDGWYLNAWLRAYDLTGDSAYLAEAGDLFQTMLAGWDDTCRGGVWWNVERTYKNAITNELFLLAAARLARRTAREEYLGWARRSWEWFDGSGMINERDLVNDGLAGDCVNNGQTTWTYNQGVILGALVELWRATGDARCLDRAARIATAATHVLSIPAGEGGRDAVGGPRILREPGEPGAANQDSHVFKGVFAQGLARLHAADPRRYAVLGAFLRANAEAVWRRATTGGFGMCWSGPPGPVNAATRASAALLLGAVDLMRRGGEAVGPPAVPGGEALRRTARRRPTWPG